MASRPGPVRVGVVNDFALVTAGVRGLLEPFADQVEVREYVGELPEGEDLDVVLFDPFGRPDPAGRLSALVAATDARVVVYGWATHPEQLRTAFRVGAVGFVPKTAPRQALLEATLNAAAGRPVPVPDLDEAESAAMEAWPGQRQGLTTRESEVLAMVVAGLSNQEIADTAYLSINTVKTYIRTAYRRMGVTTRSQAVLWGLEHGFRPADPEVLAD